MYSANKLSNGNYEIFFNGQRVSTGSSSILGNYGLSPTQLTSSQPAPTAIGTQSTTQATTPQRIISMEGANTGTYTGQMSNPAPTQQTSAAPQAGPQAIPYESGVNSPGLYRVPAGYNIPNGSAVKFNGTIYRVEGDTLNPYAYQGIPASAFTNAQDISYYDPQNANKNNTNQSNIAPPTNPGSSQPNLSGLPPEFQQLYTQLDSYLQKLQANGQVLNPNVTIDPSKTAEFLTQAHSEIDPYYKGQLQLATDSLSKQINYATQNQTNQETQAQRDYSNNLRTLGENSADQGFAQSGIRQRQEGDLAYNTQNSIDESRRQLSYNAGNAASSFAQKYGSSALPSFNIGGAPRVLAGESNFGAGGSSSPLYELSPNVYNGLVGSEQYQQTADLKNRASQLEGAFRTTQGINQARQLTI